MEIANAFMVIVLFATLVEFLVNVLKGVIPQPALVYLTPKLLALVVGVILAVTFRLDVFAMLGFATPYIWVPIVTTGLIISTGAVPVHELISKLRETRTQV